jgi:hypothetical protein
MLPLPCRIPWDFPNASVTVPAEVVFRPLAEGGCPLVRT